MRGGVFQTIEGVFNVTFIPSLNQVPSGSVRMVQKTQREMTKLMVNLTVW